MGWKMVEIISATRKDRAEAWKGRNESDMMLGRQTAAVLPHCGTGKRKERWCEGAEKITMWLNDVWEEKLS